MVDHPTVVAAARIWDSHRHPRLTVRSGIPIVSYCRTRVYLDRDAWEMLPPDGVLLMRVEPSHGPRLALALTADELERVFGEVRTTASWRDLRCYHFPTEPPAARAFVVNLAGTGGASAGVTGDVPRAGLSNAYSDEPRPRPKHLARRWSTIQHKRPTVEEAIANAKRDYPPGTRIESEPPAASEKRASEPKKLKQQHPGGGRGPSPKKKAKQRRRQQKKYTTFDDGIVSVRTVSGGGFETNRKRH